MAWQKPIKITMKTKSNKTFFTDNFILAAYLLTESCPLLYCDKSNPRRVIFHFEDSEERERLTQQFLGYEAKIEPHKFFSAQKDLKQMIYQNE